MSAEKSGPDQAASPMLPTSQSTANGEINTVGTAVGSVEEGRALNIAKRLIDAGIPVFAAPPIPGKPGEYQLPKHWEKTVASPVNLDRWRPGWALAAVGGHAADFLDVDPRNGGNKSLAEVVASKHMPRSFGQQATPSGGTHYLISPTGERKSTNFLPGLDLQAGAADGVGRGFVWIAPTVRKSKNPDDNGALRAYRWAIEPDVDALREYAGCDDSTTGIVTRVQAKRSTPKQRQPAVANLDDPFMIPSDLERGSARPVPQGAPADGLEVRRRLEAMRDALAAWPLEKPGGNAEAARLAFFAGQYVGAGQVGQGGATDTLLAALDAWSFLGGDRAKQEESIRRNVADGMRSPRAWNAGRDVREELGGAGGAVSTEESARARRVDLMPYLDGTYVAPDPERGGYREDGVRLLYPEKWHTLVALTGAGKSWHGAWHALQELRGGGVVVYAHFEESSPAGTLDRMLSLGATREELAERFVWLDCSRAWRPGEFAAALPGAPSAVILDGINAACSQHGWPVNEPSAIGDYRRTFVTPSTTRGAAVLSLGHPPKAKDRQGERHGFGSTAWLDEVDGVGFRLVAAKKTPIRRDRKGYSALYSVKDRYGQVERHGELAEESDKDGWYYLGAFTVDSSPERPNTVAYLTVPQKAEEETEEPGAKALRPILEKVREVLGKHPEGLSRKKVQDLCVGIRNARVDEALALMQEAGTVREERGARNALIQKLVDPLAGGQEGGTAE